MTGLPENYDAWRQSSPDDERHEIGTEDGQPCLRYHEPDEDAPRGYKPKPCEGMMIKAYAFEEGVACDTCGEIAQ